MMMVKMCSGYSLEQLQVCIDWISTFKEVPLDLEFPPNMYSKIRETDHHNIQVLNKAILPAMHQLYQAEMNL
jgi:hypothetical protein